MPSSPAATKYVVPTISTQNDPWQPICRLCAVTHVGYLLRREIAGDEGLLGSEVGESSNWLDVDACV